MIRAAAGLLLPSLGPAAMAAPAQGGYVTKKQPSREISPSVSDAAPLTNEGASAPAKPEEAWLELVEGF